MARLFMTFAPKSPKLKCKVYVFKSFQNFSNLISAGKYLLSYDFIFFTAKNNYLNY